MRVDKLRELFGLDDSEVRACWAPLLLLCSICPTAASRGCDVEHYMIRRAGERNMQQLLSQHQHMTPTSAVPSTPPPPRTVTPHQPQQHHHAHSPLHPVLQLTLVPQHIHPHQS